MEIVGKGKLAEKQKRIIKDENLYEEMNREKIMEDMEDIKMEETI